MKQIKSKKRAIAWAWLCDFGLCHYAEPSYEDLARDGKPTPEARAIRVRLVPTTKKHRKAIGL